MTMNVPTGHVESEDGWWQHLDGGAVTAQWVHLGATNAGTASRTRELDCASPEGVGGVAATGGSVSNTRMPCVKRPSCCRCWTDCNVAARSVAASRAPSTPCWFLKLRHRDASMLHHHRDDT